MLQIRDLSIEYQKEPLGLDEKHPRFSWKLQSDQQDVRQVAYSLLVRNESGHAVWKSGRVKSDESVLIPYAGEALSPCTRYDVCVQVEDNKGATAGADTHFETGLLSGMNFQAEWISPRESGPSGSCPVLQKHFSLLNKKVCKARLYATAHGLYEAALNGQKVGDGFLAPGWTSYHHRLQYQTYDVTSLLQNMSGSVQWSLMLADGWYKGPFTWYEKADLYGNRLAVLAELHIFYEDDDEQIIRTDSDWQAGEGEVRYSEIYHGEQIDRTFSAPLNNAVDVLTFDHAILTAQETPPVRILHRRKPVKKFRTPKGELVLDFGQDMSGFVSFSCQYPRGTKLSLQYVETLDRFGNVYTLNLRTARCRDTFVTSGEKDTFTPHFTFHGFRYVELLGFPDDVAADDFLACAIHTDLSQTGSFTCSDERVNRLQQNIQWSQRDNFVDIPTDCPQRDERLGWTGDAQMFARTASYNMLTASFFTKWLRDLAADQTQEHGVPHVVPNVLEGSEGAAAWSDAATIVPWTVYLCYGDKRILQKQYASMKGWGEYIRAQAGEKNLWQSGFQYGDWLGLDMEAFWPERVRFGLDYKENIDRIGATDPYLVASAFYAYSTQIVRDTARVLGYAEDEQTYTDLLEHILQAFRQEYVTPNGRLLSETQTACVLALHFNLIQEEDRPRVIRSLVENIHRHGDHLTTGFVGTPYLCHVLTDNGEHELAAKLLLNDDYPSWLYEVKMGATTTWERWNSIHPDGTFDETGMNSLNHYAYGAVGDWLYRKVAGIDTLDAGYQHLLLQPRLTKGLTFAAGQLETMYGKVASSWQLLDDSTVKIDFVIPANCRAEVHLPQKDPFTLGSGTYHYEYQLKA